MLHRKMGKHVMAHKANDANSPPDIFSLRYLKTAFCGVRARESLKSTNERCREINL